MATSVRDTETWELDDWSSIIQFDDATLWNTPDPSKTQEDYKGFGYSTGTYHEASTEGRSFSLNFTGTRVAIHGATGPDFGTFNVKLDGAEAGYSAYATERTNSTQLWEATGLAAGPWHTLTVINGNASFLLDHIVMVADIAASGKDSHTTIVEETGATLKGAWSFNKHEKFSSGQSGYTNETGASTTLDFEGSVIAILGDTNSDHGPYTVQVDDQEPVTLKSSTGCALPWTPGGRCELTDPNIMYLQHYLDDKPHKITITNANASYIDIDRFIVVKPDEYYTATTTPGPSGSSTATPTISGNGASQGTPIPTGSGPSNPSGSSTPGDDAGHRAVLSMLYLPIMLWVMFFH